MKIRTNVRAGGISPKHNQRMAGIAAGVAAFCTVFSAGASAQCGTVAQQAERASQTAFVWQEPLSPQAEAIDQKLPQAQSDDGPDAPITGFWKTTYVSGGAVVNIGFDQWHSDGTQMS